MVVSFADAVCERVMTALPGAQTERRGGAGPAGGLLGGKDPTGRFFRSQESGFRHRAAAGISRRRFRWSRTQFKHKLPKTSSSLLDPWLAVMMVNTSTHTVPPET